jgi:hypothetical protein
MNLSIAEEEALSNFFSAIPATRTGASKSVPRTSRPPGRRAAGPPQNEIYKYHRAVQYMRASPTMYRVAEVMIHERSILSTFK